MNIVFDAGIKEYELNECCTVRFNPTDIGFSERIFSTFNELDKKQESYKAQMERAADNVAVFELARSMDSEMREMIDTLLGDGVSNALFDGMNVYALAGGLPVWANLMLALMDEIDTSYAKEQKATNARVEKYLKKYHR